MAGRWQWQPHCPAQMHGTAQRASKRDRLTHNQSFAIKTMPVLAALQMLGFAMLGAANNGYLSTIMVLVQAVLAGVVFVVAPVDRVWLRSIWPVGLTGLTLAFWAALPLAIRWLHLPDLQLLLSPDLHQIGLLTLCGQIVLFMAMTQVARHSQACLHLVDAMALLALPIIALSLVAIRLEWINPAFLGLETARTQRFSGSIGNPNVAGVIFAMLTLLAMGATVPRFRNWLARPSDRALLMLAYTGATCGFCLALTLATQSRTAILLLLPAFALLCIWSARSCHHHRLAVAGFLGFLALPVVLAFDRLQGLAEDGAGRWAIWERFWLIARDAPWTGYGLGSFIEVNQRQLTNDSAPTMWDFGAAHAAPLQLVIELGWPGLALTVALLLAVAWRLIRHQGQLADPVALSMLLAMMLPLGASLVDIAMNAPAVSAMVASLTGMLYGRCAAPPAMRN